MDIINTVVKTKRTRDKCSPVRIKDIAEKQMGYYAKKFKFEAF